MSVLDLDPPRLVQAAPLVTVSGVSKRYGSVEALRNVAAEVYPGEVLGIVGESGSGKSTLLRMMNLEELPDAGTYELALPETPGNLWALDRYARRQLTARHIGIVYQNPHLGLLMRHSSSGNVAERLLVAGERSFQTLRAEGHRGAGGLGIPARPGRCAAFGALGRHATARATGQGHRA